MIAGEYGERKGRAHWHAVLFFKGKVPSLPIGRSTSWNRGMRLVVPKSESDHVLLPSAPPTVRRRRVAIACGAGATVLTVWLVAVWLKRLCRTAC